MLTLSATHVSECTVVVSKALEAQKKATRLCEGLVAAWKSLQPQEQDVGSIHQSDEFWTSVAHACCQPSKAHAIEDLTRTGPLVDVPVAGATAVTRFGEEPLWTILEHVDKNVISIRVRGSKSDADLLDSLRPPGPEQAANYKIFLPWRKQERAAALDASVSAAAFVPTAASVPAAAASSSMSSFKRGQKRCAGKADDTLVALRQKRAALRDKTNKL